MAKEGKRAHRATYAADKKKGGYLIRIVGPHATEFVGREVPVTMKNGDEHTEKLLRLIWSGLDTGTPDEPGTGLPVSLYAFEAKPKEKVELVF